MNTKIKINLSVEYNRTCYIQYYSEVGQFDLGDSNSVRTNLLDNNSSILFDQLSNTTKNLPSISIVSNDKVLVIYGKQYGMCFTLGIMDYSNYTKSFITNGDYYHEYMVDDVKFVSILSKNLQQTLIDSCIALYLTAYGKAPEEIYIKVSSKKEYPTKLIFEEPDDLIKYKKIENHITIDLKRTMFVSCFEKDVVEPHQGVLM